MKVMALLSLLPDLEDRNDSEHFDRGAARELLKRVVRVPWVLSVACIAVLTSTAAFLISPILLGRFVDLVLVARREELLLGLALSVFVVECLRVLSVFVQNYTFSELGHRMMFALRQEVLEALERLPLSIYDRIPVGKLVNRVTQDVAALSELFTSGFITVVVNLLMVVGILVGLCVLDLKLGLSVLALMPVVVWITLGFTSRLKIAYRRTRTLLSGLNAYFAETFLGIKVVQLFSREAQRAKEYELRNHAYTESQIATVHVFAILRPLLTVVSGVAMASVIYFGGDRVRESGIALGTWVAFFSYVTMLFDPIFQIIDKWNSFLSGMSSAERVFSLLKWEQEQGLGDLKQQPQRSPEPLRGEICFERVSFEYVPGHPVLSEVSFRIQAGERVGVVGATGSGKSTLVALLLRLYEPGSGRILLDGKDLRSYSKRDLRTRIGWIQQEAFLFSGSLEENIALWREGSEFKTEDLGALRGRELGERGFNLSTGERQWIAYLRAESKAPELWVLDEATANVDSLTEVRIQERLKQQALGKTWITVAHRLASVCSADRILVLHQGKLVEEGAPQELIGRDGEFARLLQNGRNN
jgi:ATP-binding cassette subfamily B multidrug efflux pump